MARLLFLGASVSQFAAIRYARSIGHEVIAVDGDRDAVAFAVADAAECVNFSDIDAVVKVARKWRIDGVLAVSSDRAVAPAAAVAERLGLPGVGSEVAKRMTDKAAMRACLAAAGIPQPTHAVVGNLDELRRAAGSLRWPAVLKPVDSGGQRGLFLVESERDAAERLPEALELSRSTRAILEEHIEGGELNGLLVVRNGDPFLLTLSDRLRPQGLGFGVGWIHLFPSELPGAVLDRARDVAFAAVSALGLRNGIAFPQLIADGRGEVYVVEVAARIPAGQMADLVSSGTGVSLFDIAIAQALGEPLTDALITPSFQRPIAIRFFTSSPGPLPAGTVQAIDGLAEVRDSPGVLAADIYFDVGETIRPVQVDADRRGYVVATASSARAALAAADEAAAKLRVTVAPEPASEPQRVRPARRRLAWRLAPVVVVLVAAVGTAVAFLTGEGAKLQRPLLSAARVTREFSPVCGCRQDVAHLTFRLLTGTRVVLQVVNTAGRPVATLVHDRLLRRGMQHFLWNGRTSADRIAANGSYRPELQFPALDRTLVLSNPIQVDTVPPRVLGFTVHPFGKKPQFLVRYRFDEPAHAQVTVNGRRVGYTRSAGEAGSFRWLGRLGDGRRIRPGVYRVALAGTDLAGNTSRPTVLRVRLA
jgi:biotin carboxylase